MNADEFREQGWHSVMGGEIPPSRQSVEFAREDGVHIQLPWFGTWDELPPEFNVAGLWWRRV